MPNYLLSHAWSYCPLLGAKAFKFLDDLGKFFLEGEGWEWKNNLFKSFNTNIELTSCSANSNFSKRSIVTRGDS